MGQHQGDVSLGTPHKFESLHKGKPFGLPFLLAYRKIIALLLSPETYRSVEKKLGEREAQEHANALDASANAVDKVDKALAKVDKAFVNVRDKRTFSLVDIAELKAEIARIEFKLDRKFTLMFMILLFTIIFLNQNALEFIAKLLRLM